MKFYNPFTMVDSEVSLSLRVSLIVLVFVCVSVGIPGLLILIMKFPLYSIISVICVSLVRVIYAIIKGK